MKTKFRCNCPITSALDIVGDKWVLVIIKQMLFEEKQTFKDFIESDEAIATNILTAKLKMLHEMGIVSKYKLPNNKKSVYYRLTEQGLSLAPVIIELAIWGDENVRDYNPTMWEGQEISLMKSNKTEVIQTAIENYKKKLPQEMVKA